MPEVTFKDAQQAIGFVVPELYRTHASVLQIKYPSFDYSGIIPVNTEGDMWDIGTLVYSGDVAGAASYISGKGFDIPNASVNFSQGITGFHLAGAGYELTLQEVNRASRMNVTLGDRKASAARMIAEKFIYDRVIRGSTEKNFTGLINNAGVPTANAPTGGWGAATVANILADVNTVLNDVITNSGETAMPDTLLLPTSRFLTLNNTQLTNASVSLLKFIQDNNSFTAITGRPLDVRASRELETAGAGSTKRMIAYEKSPDNMEFFLPGMFEFMPSFPISSMSWRINGVMNVGQVEVYRPKAMSYRDNI